MGPSTIALHEAILAALDSAVAASEWEVADQLLYAMEALCKDDELDPRLGEAYGRVRELSRREQSSDVEGETVPEVTLESTLTCPHRVCPPIP